MIGWIANREFMPLFHPPHFLMNPQQTLLPEPPRRNAESRANAMTQREHAVLVLDDDASNRNSVERLLTDQGYRVRSHQKPDEFFRAGLPAVPACLILDNQLGHDLTGAEVQAELQRRGWDIPTVFMTAHWSVRMVVEAIRAGADGFLTKPCDPAELVDAVAHALQRSQVRQRDEMRAAAARARVGALTPRERQIVHLVAGGLLNKDIADRLNLAEITVKVHRSHAMHKLGAGNAAELVHIVTRAGITG